MPTSDATYAAMAMPSSSNGPVSSRGPRRPGDSATDAAEEAAGARMRRPLGIGTKA